MKIIFSICSWGLGHSTRSLPIIRKLLSEGNALTIISSGRSLELLKKEIGDQATYVDIPDYPMLLSENSRQFIAKSLVYWPLFIKRMEEGLQALGRLLQRQECDLIVSDGRYDMYSKKIPSFFISHQMRIMNPLRITLLERGSETFNMFFFKRFKGIIIPDFKDDSYAGDLSHNLSKIDENSLHYVGLLSDFKRTECTKDIDYFISLSGPEPQRSILEKKIIKQLDHLSGNIILTLGKTEMKETDLKQRIQTYNFLSKDQREDLLNRSKVVISRSGYSTISDLAVIGTKALMIPTPGQVEQEYLASFHHDKGTCVAIDQDKLDLNNDVKKIKNIKGFQGGYQVSKTVNAILSLLNDVN